MLPKKWCGPVVIFFAVGLSSGAETINQAMVKAIDYERNSITVTVGGRDFTYAIHKDAKVWMQPIGMGKVLIEPQETPSDLSAVHACEMVSLTVEKVGSKSFVKTLKVAPRLQLSIDDFGIDRPFIKRKFK